LARSRATEDFVQHWQHLRDVTRDNPSGVRQALDEHPDLDRSIERLHDIEEQVDRHRKYANRRFIVQAHPEFRTAFLDFKQRWGGAYDDLYGWYEATGKVLTMAELLAESLALIGPEDPTAATATQAERPGDTDGVISAQGTTVEKQSKPPPDDHEYPSDFDPDRDDIAWIIEEIERDCRQWGREPWEQQRAEALKWLRETVGLNFEDLQTRWQDFPVIVVPQSVSDKYSIDGRDGLFGYLTQVRLAYIIGADRAAIALCRAVTELLFLFHYGGGNKRDNKRMGLPQLIESIQESGKFEFLKKLNLAEKVRDANKILHDTHRDDIKHRDRDRGLITDWVRALEEVIDKAPAGGPADEDS
jgi:hypothetical protein